MLSTITRSAVALAACTGLFVLGAGTAAAATPTSYEISSADSTHAPRPCLAVLTHPATLVNSAVVTRSGCDDPAYSTTPVSSRLRWFVDGAGVAGRIEIASAIPGHNNLCAVEYVPTHQIRLNVCPIYTTTPSKYPNRMWSIRTFSDLDLREASELVNGQTHRCMSVDLANAVHNDNIYTYPCSSAAHLDLKQLWQKRIAPGTG